MALVCSRCGQLFEQAAACSRCGAAAPAVDAADPPFRRGPEWLQTSWGRILIGLILAQGLFYGLRHLITGFLLATGATADWDDLQFLLVLQAIQVAGLLLGGVLAGAGQSHGPALGAVVGVWNGVLAVMLRQNPAQDLTVIGLFGQPLLHAAFCLVGGVIGSWVWKPLPPSGVPLELATARKQPPRREVSLMAGRIAWWRILMGSAFAVSGSLSASMIFQGVLDASDGRLGTTNYLQDRLITWEIKALALLAGGAVAGGTTTNGLKQGVFVGLVSAVLLIAFQPALTESWALGAALTTVSTFSLASVGGWFGGQLFPYIVRIDRRRRGLIGLR